MDDLSSSIMDGRFHEQKYRLKQCGLKHHIYLVENMRSPGGQVHHSIPADSLSQAVINTQVTLIICYVSIQK